MTGRKVYSKSFIRITSLKKSLELPFKVGDHSAGDVYQEEMGLS